MADSCGNVVNTDDLKAAKEAIQHIEHVSTSRDAAGNPALSVTDTIRGNSVTNKTLNGLTDQIDKIVASLDVGNFTFPDIVSGIAGTTNLQYFRVPGEPNTGIAFNYYRNNNGFAEYVTSISDNTGLALTVGVDGAVYAKNDDGFTVMMLAPDGYSVINGKKITDAEAILELQNDDGFTTTVISKQGNVIVGGMEITPSENVLQLQNDDGFTMVILDPNGNTVSQPVPDDQAWINSGHQKNLAGALRISTTTLTDIPPLASKYIQFIFTGQSFMSGQEGWPSKTLTQPFDNLMLGNSTRPINMAGLGTWQTLGGSDVLKPLVATTQTYSANSQLLSASQQAALPAGDGALGEDISVGTLNLLRKFYLSKNQIRGDFSRRFISTNCGISGRNLNCLMNSDDFVRIPRSAQIIKTLADSDSATAQLGGIFIAHGEFDSTNTPTGQYVARPTREDYLSGLTQYIAKIRESVGRDVYGMSDYDKIPVFIYQVGGTYTSDTMGVAMAQIDATQTIPNVFMIGSYSFMPDKNAHLAPNGYRWLSQFFAKTAIQTLIEKKSSTTCSVSSAVAKGNQVVVNILSTHYPLQIKTAYVVNTPVNHPDLGFTLKSGSTRLNIVSAEIISPSQVLLTCDADLPDDVVLLYADKTYHQGVGNVFDSDATQSMYSYDYVQGSGDYAASNIPALVGLPYSLNNPLLATLTTVEKL